MRTDEATTGIGPDLMATAATRYLPFATDLYFPVEDARYEATFIPHATLLPIPSLWGHTASAASNPADAKFLNDHIGAFMETGGPARTRDMVEPAPVKAPR